MLAAARPYFDRPTIARLFVDRDPATTERGSTIIFTDPIDASHRTIELDSSIAPMRIRFLLAEDMDAIEQNAPASQLQGIATRAGMRTLRERGVLAVEAGVTTAAEVLRVLGTVAP